MGRRKKRSKPNRMEHTKVCFMESLQLIKTDLPTSRLLNEFFNFNLNNSLEQDKFFIAHSIYEDIKDIWFHSSDH